MEIQKRAKVSIFFRIKRWLVGIAKEFKRIQWINRKTLGEHLIIVVVFLAIFVALFMAFDALVLQTGLLGN